MTKKFLGEMSQLLKLSPLQRHFLSMASRIFLSIFVVDGTKRDSTKLVSERRFLHEHELAKAVLTPKSRLSFMLYVML